MSKFKRKAKNITQVSTASLPDIVFLLLFYFMVSATIREKEDLVKTKIPNAHYLTETEKKFLVKEVQVGFPKDKAMGRQPRITAAGRYLNPSDIGQWVSEQREELPGFYEDKMIVLIRADRNVEMGIITDLQQELRKVNARKIVYKSMEKEKE